MVKDKRVIVSYLLKSIIGDESEKEKFLRELGELYLILLGELFFELV